MKVSASNARWILVLLLIAVCFTSTQIIANPLDESNPNDLQHRVETLEQQLLRLSERLDKLEEGRVNSPQPDKPVRTVSFELTGNFIGDPDAKWTLVEFLDLECPFCRRFHQTTMLQIESELIDKGKLNWVVKDLPLDFHLHARYASHAVRCAGESEKEAALRNAILVDIEKLSREEINRQAIKVGLNSRDYQSCMDSGRYDAAIQDDMNQAAELNIRGTPTFVLGQVKNQQLNNGKVFSGAMGYAQFEGLFNEITGAVQGSPDKQAETPQKPAPATEAVTAPIQLVEVNDLLWTESSSTNGMTQSSAISYCATLRNPQCESFRLPEIDQLTQLQELGENNGLRLAIPWAWSATPTLLEKDNFLYYNFLMGEARSSRPGSSDIGALCICVKK